MDFAERLLDHNFGSGAGAGSWDPAGIVGNWRRRRAGAGDGARFAHGPAPCAGDFAVYITATDRARCTTAILESGAGGPARRDFLCIRHDFGRVAWRPDRGSDVHSAAQSTFRRISDVFRAVVVDES